MKKIEHVREKVEDHYWEKDGDMHLNLLSICQDLILKIVVMMIPSVLTVVVTVRFI